MERHDQAELVGSVHRAERTSPYPPDVAHVLSFLANLIDASIAVRGVRTGPRELAAQHLGVGASEVVVTSRELGTVAFQLVAVAFAADLRDHDPVQVVGDDPDHPPRWERLDLGGETVTVPFALTACFGTGTLADPPLVVQFTEKDFDEGFVLRVSSRAADVDAAGRWLDDLVRRARAASPFRNRLLRAHRHRAFGLCFKVLDPLVETRGDLVLRPSVWEEVDRSVHGLFASLDRLRAAGLACNRGVLVAGPPGTGKTALCRILASELAGRVTVVLCDASAVSHEVTELYRELEHLAPALVVMEDVDLVIGSRLTGSDGLVSFLGALDGVMTRHAGVVTIATTNEPAAIDAAARRAGRFDAVIAVDPPDRDGREAILHRYLRHLDAGVDVGRVAIATAGATGAILRELVTRAVLDAHARGEPITTDGLLRLAAEGAETNRPGQYL